MLHIIRGLPGAGKSTYAKKLKAHRESCGKKVIHIEADMFHIQPDGSYRYNPDLSSMAHEWCQLTTMIYLMNGYEVIVSNTSLTINNVTQYVDIAKKCNCGRQVTIVVDKEKHFKNTHGVPEETLLGMAQKLENYPGEKVFYNKVGAM